MGNYMFGFTYRKMYGVNLSVGRCFYTISAPFTSEDIIDIEKKITEDYGKEIGEPIKDVTVFSFSRF